MPIVSLETALGSTAGLQSSAVIYNSVPGLPELRVTANFAGNVAGNQNTYILLEAPINPFSLILNTVATEEKNKIADYARKIEDWNKKERDNLDEYWLEQEITEEEARKAPLDRILEGMANSGAHVGPMRATLKQQGSLYPNQAETLLRLLRLRGITAESALTELREAITSGKALGQETWKLLADKFQIKIQTVPPPQLDLKEMPPLMKELEDVVRKAYAGEELHGPSLNRQAWAAADMSPEAVYDRITQNVSLVAGQYLLLEVLGTSEKEGTLKAAQLISNPPKVLRPYFMRPTQVADDAFSLAAVVQHEVQTYYRKNPGSKKFRIVPKDEEMFYFRAIFEALFGKTPLNENLLRGLNIPEHVIIGMMPKYAAAARQARDVIAAGELDKDPLSFEGVTMAKPLIEVANCVRGLVGVIPPEVYEARTAQFFIDYAKRKESTTPKSPFNRDFIEGLRKKADSYRARLPSLTAKLGHSLAKDVTGFELRIHDATAASTLLRYGFVKPAEMPVAQ